MIVRLAITAHCLCGHTLRFHPEGKACDLCTALGVECQRFLLMNRKMRRTQRYRQR